MTTAADASWADQREHPGQRQPPDPGADPGREPQHRPQPQAQPPGREDRGRHQRQHAEGGPARQQVLRRRRQLVQPVAEHVRAADRAEGGVGADHDQRRQQRRERGAVEPPVGLQDPVQHDREPVQQHLRREDDQHPGADAGHHRARAAGGVRKQHGDDRVRGQRQRRADRHQQQHRPGQQRRRDPPGRVGGRAASPAPRRPAPRPARAPPAPAPPPTRARRRARCRR